MRRRLAPERRAEVRLGDPSRTAWRAIRRTTEKLGFLTISRAARSSFRDSLRHMTRGFLARIGAAVVFLGVLGIDNGCAPPDRELVAISPSCPVGFVECDGNPETVCETDTTSSLDHCGMCEHACAARMDANIGCVAGTCSITSCNNGHENCDNFYDNGCETNIATNNDHCGSCGNSCQALTPNAMTMTCMNSICAIEECNANFGNCNLDPVDGCETDFQSDPLHCTACAMSCGGGECNNGVCTPEILVAQLDTPAGEIAIFKDNIYIGSRGASAAILRVPVSGGDPILMGTALGAVNAITVNALGIFTAGAQGASRMDLDGTNKYDLDYGTARGIAADMTNVYWSASNSIRFGPANGGAFGTLLSAVTAIHSVALDVNSNVIYWAPTDSSVWSSPINSPLPKQIASGTPGSNNIVLDGTNVYWSSNQGIHSAPIAGGGTVNTLAPSTATVRALAVDDKHVYWTDEFANLVQRVAKDGSTPPELLAQNQFGPYGIALDSTYVYWSNMNIPAIWKVHK